MPHLGLRMSRFDVRALMEVMPPGWGEGDDDLEHHGGGAGLGGLGHEEQPRFERFLAYERYRSIVEAYRRRPGSELPHVAQVIH